MIIQLLAANLGDFSEHLRSYPWFSCVCGCLSHKTALYPRILWGA